MWPICLDNLADSNEVFQGLNLVAERFTGMKPCQSRARADWLAGLPHCIGELYEILTRWEGAVSSFPGGFGTQDFIFLPPKRLEDGRLLLVQENQGGFEFSIAATNAVDRGIRTENSDTQEVSIRGYLVSAALHEMVMSAPLWAIDEEMRGYSRRLAPEMTLLWTDRQQFYPHGDLRFYWHRAGALVLCDHRGRGDVGCHKLELQGYFENYGFYSPI